MPQNNLQELASDSFRDEWWGIYGRYLSTRTIPVLW